MNNPKIVHLHIKEPPSDDCFSSIIAMYQYYGADVFGIKYRSLVNALHGNGVYENKRIIVRVGTIKSAKQCRKSD